MNTKSFKKTIVPIASVLATAAVAAGAIFAFAQGADAAVSRAALPAGLIKNIVVIDLENSPYGKNFGAGSVATYLNTTLAAQGQVIPNYFATSHVSQGNYISQVSGQAPTADQNSDCIDASTLASTKILGAFTDVTPATPTDGGQVVGNGCVFPASVKTIGDQLDAAQKKLGLTSTWKMYAEDMGNDPARDYGTVDPMGGTTCAHPPINGQDNSNSASATDQYATRHTGFLYFHSVIDNQKNCDAKVVPLGTVSTGKYGYKDMFQGHLATDFASIKTTPAFSFIAPNLCNDAHDAKCVGPDAENNAGGTGLSAGDTWLKHWIPFIMSSPAYKAGQMLIVLTFDESGPTNDFAALPGQPAGPNTGGNPGLSPLLVKVHYLAAATAAGQYPGGGQVGALLLNSKYIKPGTVNNTGAYNHFSALRSYEDLLGLTTGGTDGLGHLGYAAQTGLVPFGADVFDNYKPNKK